MRFPDPSFRLFGIAVHFHWSCPLMTVVIIVQALYAADWRVALMNASVGVAFLLGVLLHELCKARFAAQLGLPTRDIFLYPVCGYARLGIIGERPRREVWLAVASLALGGVFAALLTTILLLNGWSFEPVAFDTAGGLPEFFNRLFWCQVLFAMFNILPTFPFGGAALFRSSLALTTSRLRATEVAATLGTLVALVLILLDLFRLRNGMLGVLAVFVFVMSQYELAYMKYFFELRHPQTVDRGRHLGSVPMEQVIDPETRPPDVDFSGFTWNGRARMWIEWRDGQAVSASAILGDG